MTVACPLPTVTRVTWAKTFRLVPSRYPPVQLFERVGDPADWETLAQLEGLTNDRLRDEVGNIALVPIAERLAGNGATPIMAAFTHTGHPSRFTDGSYGVYYASDSLPGALAEVLYHHARFLRRTHEVSTDHDFRVYVGRIGAELHDLRGGWPELHSPDSYVASQTLARTLRTAGSNGLVYDNVRSPPGANIAVFRPAVLASPDKQPHVVQASHIRAHWDGARMDRYFVFGEHEWVALSP